MKKFNLFKIFYSIVCFTIIFLLSHFILKYNNDLSNSKIMSDDFLLNFLGLLLGLGIAIITFLYSAYDKLREALIKSNINSSISDKMKETLKSCFIAIKKDLFYIFYLFLFCIIVIFFRDMDFPKIEWSLQLFYKTDLVNFCKLTILFSSLLAIFDIIYSLFALMQAGEKFSN